MPLRVVLIATALAAALFVLPLSGQAQTRPAPDTTGEPQDSAPQPLAAPRYLTNAVRVLVVTSGIIGGFVAADLLSGGVLTAPLLSGGAALTAEAATVGRRLLPRGAALRPIIVPPLQTISPGVRLPELRQAIGRSLTRGTPATPSFISAAAPARIPVR